MFILISQSKMQQFEEKLMNFLLFSERVPEG